MEVYAVFYEYEYYDYEGFMDVQLFKTHDKAERFSKLLTNNAKEVIEILHPEKKPLMQIKSVVVHVTIMNKEIHDNKFLNMLEKRISLIERKD